MGRTQEREGGVGRGRERDVCVCMCLIRGEERTEMGRR